MQHNVLRSVHEGMKVYDARNKEIGRVDWVQFGNDNPATPAAEAETVEGSGDPRRDGLIDNVIDAFRVDELPESVRDRLLMQGFVRIDAEGIFAADRYILPDQISSVSDDGLTLKVEKEELVRRH
jgi:hypothetical protein